MTLKICSSCEEEFVDHYKNKLDKLIEENGLDVGVARGVLQKQGVTDYRVCPDCRPGGQSGQQETDVYQYTRKGEGYRLIAGFNILNNGNEDEENDPYY